MYLVSRFILGLMLLIPGALSLYTFVDPELPVRLAFRHPGMPEPLATIVQKWFQFANFLQTAHTSDYLGALFLCFGLTLTGIFTCIRKSQPGGNSRN